MLQTDTSIIKLDIDLIVPNKYQPRKVFDERTLNSLAESIKNYGILNPILVRKKEDKYEIIAGERRFRAAKQIGLTEVPVLIKDANEQQMAELALIENLERQNLNAIEEAKSYEEIMRIGNQTQESLAKKLGKSQSTIANKIRLLSLPIEIQDAVTNQKISERHARSLVSVKDKDKQIHILNRIINEKLTVKETERIINEKDFTEKEIKKAIDDIMKSLSMVETPTLNEEIKEPKLEIKEEIKETPNEKTEEIKNIEEKEEKEDDNMNNGNFFPNFDNNAMNNNTSLNMMNAQSMNAAPMAPSNETVMPSMNQPIPEPQMAPTMPTEINPIPDFNQFGSLPTMDQNFGMNQAPMMPVEQPMMDNLTTPEPMAPTMSMESNPIPDFSQFGPTSSMDQNFGMNQTPMMPVEQPMMDNLMAPEPMAPTMPMESNPGTSLNQFDMPSMNAPLNTPQMMDTPLFNPDAVMPSMDNSFTEPVMPLENNGFEVPVVMPQENMMSTQVQTNFGGPTQDKLTELINYLSANGYNYKSYGNDTENCVIIEIPKNY